MFTVAKVGPGLTLMDLDTLGVRLAFLGLNERAVLKGFLNHLGVGALITETGEYVPWELFVMRLLEHLGSSSIISVDQGRVESTPSDAATNPQALVMMALLFDKAFEGTLTDVEIAQKSVAGARLLQDLKTLMGDFRYGL